MSKYPNGPYKNIPSELLQDYTMNYRIPVFDWYIDGSKKNGVQWSNELIDEYRHRFTPENIMTNREGKSSYGNHVCVNLLLAFQKYNLVNKNIAVVGSETPWIEAILINLKNNVTTIEYNVPKVTIQISNVKIIFCFSRIIQIVLMLLSHFQV